MKPFEFEKVSAEAARWARDGEPANPDAANWTDKRTRAPEEPLLNVTQTWLAPCRKMFTRWNWLDSSRELRIGSATYGNRWQGAKSIWTPCSSTAAAPARDSHRKSVRSWKRYANTMRCYTPADVLYGATWKMGGNAGRHGIRGLTVGSQVQKVLAQTKLPVLVCTVEQNAPALAMETSIAIIKDEHRSLAMVIHGLRHVLQEACYKGMRPDFALLRSMQHYIRTFPEALHHPKEDAYLFRKLRLRTDATDEVIRELQRQHAESGQRLNELSRAIDLFETGAVGGLAGFAQAFERFAESQWQHMSLEEKVILPAAQQHLTDKDWAEIAVAFGKNGDPRFGDEPDAEFRRLFTRITDLAPPNVIGGEALSPPQ